MNKSPLLQANQAAGGALRLYQGRGHKDAMILGIGAAMCDEEQMALALQFFPLYCSAAVFNPQRWGMTGVVFDKPCFFALDNQGHPAIIPPANIT